VDAGEFDGFRQKQDEHESLPRFGLPEDNDLHPACLILYCWYSLGYYNGGADEIWPRWKKRHVLAYARGIYAISDCLYPSWPPLLALIWGARSRDPVQVGYRCLRTLTSIGLLGLRVSSCSWATAGMPKVRTRGVVPSSVAPSV
jgi:hypothetical protein